MTDEVPSARTWRAGTGLLPFWEANHCCRCEVEDAGLSLAKKPPALAFPVPPPPPPPPPAPRLTPAQKQAAKDERFERNVLALMEGLSAVTEWFSQPPPPRKAAAPAAHAPAAKPAPPPAVRLKPFDIQDIPATMRKLRMPVSAAMMERWFRGQLNYSPTAQDEQEGLNQNGQPYPLSMIDKSLITMDWVLGYERAQAAFEELTEQRYYKKSPWTGTVEVSQSLRTDSVLRSPKAVARLATALRPYIQKPFSVRTWPLCNESIEQLHRDFQFQFVRVGSTLQQKIAEQLRVDRKNQGIPDDLTGALGAFNLYAAVAEFHIEPNANGVAAVVTRIAVYVKDSYTFTTPPGGPSQYLGHWNKRSVVISAYTSVSSLRFEADYPIVADKNPVHSQASAEDLIYYPVRNRSFRNWQMKHQQGGDFIAYSDVRWFRLATPIWVQL